MRRYDRLHKFLGEPENRRSDVTAVIREAFAAGANMGASWGKRQGTKLTIEKIEEGLDEWLDTEVSDTHVPGQIDVRGGFFTRPTTARSSMR